MKILVLSSQGKNTGCKLRAFYLAEALKKCGNEVIFIEPLPSLPMWLDILFSIPIYLVKSLFLKVDVAIGIKPYPNVGVALLVQKIKGAKIVIDVDDIDYGYRTGVISKFTKLVQSPFPKRADVVTYHNDNLLKNIINEFNVKQEKTYRLEQGVSFDVFGKKITESEKKEIKVKLNINNEKVLFYMGHLNIASNLDEILDAFSIVCKNFNVTLIIAGGGPLESNYKTKTQKLNLTNKIKFTGYISNYKIGKLINIADICLVYYRNQPVNLHRASMKLREYLACGKIVVANDIGELKAFSEAVYQSTSSVEKFAEKIIEVLNGKTDNREKKGADIIKNKYDWELIAKKFSDYLRDKIVK